VAGGEAPRPGWTGRRRAQRTTDPAASVDAPGKTNVFLLGGGKALFLFLYLKKIKF